MPLSVTVGTNTYISVVDAEIYFSYRLESAAWTAATADQKCQALFMAAKKIDRLILKGVKAIPTQIMEFPRALRLGYESIEEPELNHNIIFNGDWLVETDVPQPVKDAQCEEALVLLEGTPKRLKLMFQGVKSFSLGPLSESYGRGSATKLLSKDAIDYLQPYMARSVGIV